MIPTHTANPVRVQATRILEVSLVDYGRGRLLLLEDGRNFVADETMIARYSPVVGDYLVAQEDGYVYLNPKAVFERKYAPVSAESNQGTKQEIQAMVDRFLGWRLPADFGPDCYISFDRDKAEKGGWPVGTNLLTADQARQMFEHCTARPVAADGLAPPHQQRVVEERQELFAKLERLTDFLKTDRCLSLPLEERARLIRQQRAMREYAEVLGERIAGFFGTPA